MNADTECLAVQCLSSDASIGWTLAAMAEWIAIAMIAQTTVVAIVVIAECH